MRPMNSSKNKLNNKKNKLNSKKNLSFSANANRNLTFPPHYQNQPIIKIFKQVGKLGTQLGD